MGCKYGIIIKSKSLRKQYQMGEKGRCSKGCQFWIYKGEFIVVLGYSGSGKSTILNLIGGMDTITSGELYYKDKILHGASEKVLAL